MGGADLSVEEGEIFSLLGPNGAGKTTLLRILTTLLAPDAGEARVAGFDVVAEADAVRRRIGVTFQEHALDPTLKGSEVLRDSGALYGLSPGEITRRLADLAPILDMDEAMRRPVQTYSGGMKRRLELARALLSEPAVLFLDEPTQGLDPQNRQALWDHLLQLREEQSITIFLTTHYMEEAEHLSDRVAIIDHGRILKEGPPASLAGEIGGDVIYVKGEGDGAAAAAALKARPFTRWVEYERGDPGSAGESTGGMPAGAAPVGEVPADRAEEGGGGAAAPARGSGPGTIRVAVSGGGRHLAPVIQTVTGAGFEITDVEIRRPSLNEVFLRLTGRRLRDR